MASLTSVETAGDILPEYRGTPVEALLRWQNLGETGEEPDRPRMLIATCMDHRVRLRIPPRFAYVLRTGGAYVRPNEFHISFAIAVGGIRTIAMIGHTDCGMAGVSADETAFVDGLVEGAGWPRDAAATQFRELAPRFEIRDPVAFTLRETAWLRRRYPDVLAVPLLYRVEDDRLVQIRDGAE